MLAVLQTYSKELTAIAAVLLTFGLNRFLRLRPRLRYGVRHSFNHLAEHTVADENGNNVARLGVVRTASINLINAGLNPAKNVEVTFNWKPQFLNVWPARHFDSKESAYSRYTLTLESLAPSEIFGIEILAIEAELPVITSVRCDESEGKLVSMQPQQVAQNWKVITALTLMTLGLAAIGYMLAWTIQQLSS